MSFPKISNISVSFNDENNENFPVTIISSNKFKSIINKSVGTGTYDEDKKPILNKGTLITVLNTSNYLSSKKSNLINNKEKKKEENNKSKIRFHSSKKPKKKLEINSPSIISFSQLKNYKYIGKYKIPRIKSTKGNILKNQMLKKQVSFKPKPSIKYNYMKFQKRSKQINDNIVSDDISLINTLMNQTTSNFNNKYQVQYWTNDKKKKDEILNCFNLIRKGTDLTEIDNILNGPKEIITYRIQTEPNRIDNYFYESSNIKSFQERKKKANLSINTLNFIRPLTSH